MRFVCSIVILLFATAAFAQSGRVVQGEATPASSTSELSVKQMFDEANGYARQRFIEYQEKKVYYGDALLERTKLEQRQLAAKYATLASARKDLAGEDLYYLGMLHWIAQNLDGTALRLASFLSAGDPANDKAQNARSILVMTAAKQNRLEDAEKTLADYMAGDPKKQPEISRMEGEIAKAYQTNKDFVRMAPHAEADYAASKASLKEAASHANGLDEMLDAGMLVFEAYRDGGNQLKADAALDDMRAAAIQNTSPSFYFYAVDKKIKFLIETGRKPAALELYKTTLANIDTDFLDKGQRSDALARFKKRERHYALLGTQAPELLAIDQWFPGKPQTIADYRGKVVLIDFWATWCAPCFDAFPSLSEWHETLASQGLVILGVTRYYGVPSGMPADPVAELGVLKNFREKQKLPYDIVVGKDASNQLLYGSTGLPTAALIDRKGVVRYLETGTSPSRIAEMHSMILKLLAEK